MPLFDEHIEVNDRAEAKAKRGVMFPPSDASWLSPKRVEYMKNLIQALFLFLACPWLMFKFFDNPLKTVKIVGQAQVG